MRAGVELVGEQALDGIAAENAGRQADGVQHDQRDGRAGRPGVEVGGVDATRARQEALRLDHAQCLTPSVRGVGGGIANAKALHPIAQLPERDAETLGGCSPVETRFPQRLQNSVALDAIEVLRQWQHPR